MELVRSLCQIAHGQRQLANIKIRQPLSSLDLHCPSELSPELLDIIAQEVNVKNVRITKVSPDIKAILETTITPELTAEGEYRDLVRNIQVLRKNRSLRIQDKIKIFARNGQRSLKNKFWKKLLPTPSKKEILLTWKKYHEKKYPPNSYHRTHRSVLS
jgi:hypothetical protein